MTKFMCLFGLFAAVIAFAVAPSQAETLQDALVSAYENNPTLKAQRAKLRAVDEGVPQALSGWRPTVRASGDTGIERRDSSTASTNQPERRTPGSVALSVSQPIFRGGQTVAGTGRAENLVRAERASLTAVEQNVLRDVATAFTNVVRDQAVLELNTNNEQVLRRNLEAARDRFEVGEITRTDVSQAESRLARARADRIQAEGNLASSRAVYENVVGVLPGILVAPAPIGEVPESLQSTLDIASRENPGLILAEFTELAANDNVDLTFGELLPTLSLDGTLSKAYDQTARGSETESAKISAVLSVPLYQAGAVTSRVRQSRQVANQRKIEVEIARRAAREASTRAWEALATVGARITSIQAQILSAEIALEGVREEAAVGSRTVLDILDAEQELLDARASLVRATRDELVARIDLLAAIGRLTAEALDLPVAVYDAETHYIEVRDKFW